MSPATRLADTPISSSRETTASPMAAVPPSTMALVAPSRTISRSVAADSWPESVSSRGASLAAASGVPATASAKAPAAARTTVSAPSGNAWRLAAAEVVRRSAPAIRPVIVPDSTTWWKVGRLTQRMDGAATTPAAPWTMLSQSAG